MAVTIHSSSRFLQPSIRDHVLPTAKSDKYGDAWPRPMPTRGNNRRQVAGSNLKIPVSAVSSPSICDGFVESRRRSRGDTFRHECIIRATGSNRIVGNVDLFGNRWKKGKDHVSFFFLYFFEKASWRREIARYLLGDVSYFCGCRSKKKRERGRWSFLGVCKELL